uniref:AAA domain-containing protein n=1 Tax=Alistipes sp. TaxID=1872444 RepID=UPI004056ACA5
MNWEEIKNLMIRGCEAYLNEIKTRENKNKGTANTEKYSIKSVRELKYTKEGFRRFSLAFELKDDFRGWPPAVDINLYIGNGVSNQLISYYEGTGFNNTFDYKIVEVRGNDLDVIFPNRIVEKYSSDFDENNKNSTIKLSFDLSWLTKRLLDFYKKQDQEVVIPDNCNDIIHTYKPRVSFTLNVEQKSAIEQSLYRPFNYVWGPPGTGKTKAVLSYCALSYLSNMNHRNDKILIIAPTNNAVENALSTIIDESEEDDKTKILRIGVASRSFREKYPENCDSHYDEKKQEKINNKIQEFDAEIRRKETEINNLNSDKGKIKKSIEQQESDRKSKDLLVIKNDEKICDLNQKILSHEEQLKYILCQTFRFWEIRKKRQAKKDEELMGKIIEDCKNKRAHWSSENLRLRNDIIKADSSIKEKQKELDNIKNKINEKGGSLQQLKRERGKLNEELQKLTEAVNRKRERAQVLGMTIQGFIGTLQEYYDNRASVKHVFIDEAGYTSLANGLVPFALGCPITLLGDHKQLGPVCDVKIEPNRQDIQPCWVFQYSILNIYNIIKYPTTKFLSRNETSEMNVLIPDVETSKLKRTWRFGKRLAEVLNKHVYNDVQLIGNATVDTRIYSIQIPAYIIGKRGNLSEKKAIYDFLRGKPLSPYKILTPYNEQVKLLGQNPIYNRMVLTVHKSQGYEYDSILFSVADPFVDKYFTNSQTKLGRRVINTAISRAKKELIIFLDPSWVNQDQLISDLIKVSQPITL